MSMLANQNQDPSFSEPIRWKKSSRSYASVNCVEVAVTSETMLVRDSKDPEGPVLEFDAAAWRQFVADLKQGTYDLG